MEGAVRHKSHLWRLVSVMCLVRVNSTDRSLSAPQQTAVTSRRRHCHETALPPVGLSSISGVSSVKRKFLLHGSLYRRPENRECRRPTNGRLEDAADADAIAKGDAKPAPSNGRKRTGAHMPSILLKYHRERHAHRAALAVDEREATAKLAPISVGGRLVVQFDETTNGHSIRHLLPHVEANIAADVGWYMLGQYKTRRAVR